MITPFVHTDQIPHWRRTSYLTLEKKNHDRTRLFYCRTQQIAINNTVDLEKYCVQGPVGPPGRDGIKGRDGHAGRDGKNGKCTFLVYTKIFC